MNNDETKKIAPFLVAIPLILSGCGVNNDQTADENRVNVAQPMGYYSNENHEKNNTGNVTIIDGQDNDGPLVEMMDHTFGEEGKNNGNQNVKTAPIENNKTKENTYNTELAEKMANTTEKVENVKEANSLVYGDNVIIAIQVNDTSQISQTKDQIKNKLSPYVQGKDMSVITDRAIFSSIEDINKAIRNGQTDKTITNHINELIRDIDNQSN